MMPIFTGGIASIPPALVSQASAFNNLVRQASAALGVAAFTALFTQWQAQLLAARAGLLPATTPVPPLGPPGTPAVASPLALYQQTQLRAFAEGMDQLFIAVAALTAVGVVLALFLRSGPPPATGESAGVGELAG